MTVARLENADEGVDRPVGMSAEDRTVDRDLSPAEWRQIVDSAVDTAIVSTDREGRVVTWNAGATRLLGWTEAEMRGRSLECLFTEADRSLGRLAREMRDASAEGRGGGEEGWRVRKDGTTFWAVGEMSPIHDAGGGHIGYVKVVRDRTQQRAAEQALREETRALEILNRTGSALAAETDLHRLVQIITDAGVELTGAEFGAFFHNVWNSTGESYMLYTLSGVPREEFERFPMPRNTAVFGPTFRGEGIVRSDDITADPRYGHNTPHHGMPEGHLPVRSYLAVPVISRSNEVIGGLFFGHATAGIFTARSERSLAGLAAEAAVALDNARLSDSVQRELDERKRAEVALRELNATLEQQVAERTRQIEAQAEALRQSQKMEAVGQLTGGVAHDFNNLLQVITANLELIRRSLPPEATRSLRAVNAAVNGAKGAAALTQRLLAFARRQPLDPKPINLNMLVNGMSDLLYRTLGEPIDIETVLAAGLWQVEADANQLENTIINLAVNSRDAMPDGGRLTIETANSHIDEAYASANPEAAPGQYVMLSVSDTGSGMDSETVRHAFEPFFTTKPVGQGTGLGLSQVYGFVKQSGGHVKIYSEVGMGTTIRIYLPRPSGGRGEHGDPVFSSSAAPGANQEKVLVVEDHEDVRAQSVESLRELGYLVFEAADARSALRVLEQQPGEFDLLFTDVVLPGGISGAQLAAQATARWPAMRVLFTTGYARNAIVHHGRLDAGVQLLTKPFSFDELASKVRDVLEAG
jgi:PAS domain S-box-containing protein